MIKTCLKWHGGKAYLASRIIELLPPRDTWHLWREPFFGGGAVTLALDPEGLSEAVNDLNGDLVNFWRALQNDECWKEIQMRADFTPLSEDEFRIAHELLSQPHAYSGVSLPRAWAFFVRCRQSRQGLMKDFATPTRRLRRGMNENVSAWLSAVEGLPEIHERLKRIEIRNMDACDFIRKYDDPEAVFYLDPPYLHSTRSTGGGEYKHEMTEEQHGELLTTLESIKGRFLLSGYRSKMYDSFADMRLWNRVDIPIDNKASGKREKPKSVESIWMNY